MTDIITDEDKMKAAEREVAMRERVYPRWIQANRISVGKAAREIKVMKAIAADYRDKVQKTLL